MRVCQSVCVCVCVVWRNVTTRQRTAARRMPKSRALGVVGILIIFLLAAYLAFLGVYESVCV